MMRGRSGRMSKRLLVLVSFCPGTLASTEVRAECQRYIDAATTSAQAITDDVKEAKAMAEIAIAQASIGEMSARKN